MLFLRILSFIQFLLVLFNKFFNGTIIIRLILVNINIETTCGS